MRLEMDEVDLFLQVSRRCIDNGRKSLDRLTKIEANLRELRLKYVASAGEAPSEDVDSDLEIPMEELIYTKEHSHEAFVFTEGLSTLPQPMATKFKSTADKAKEEQ